MPKLYKDREPDNLWKIQRRVAKIMRENNDDDRGLAETADMSDDTDKLIKLLNNFKNGTNDILSKVYAEINLGEIEGKPLKLREVLDTKDEYLILIEKLDFNKMNRDNINKIKQSLDKYTELQSYLQGIVESVNTMEGGDIRETLVQQLQELTIALRQILDTTNLKLLNYRQTSAVLTQEGVEMIEGSGMGCSCGCCLPLEYQPQYQNQMYY